MIEDMRRGLARRVKEAGGRRPVKR